jgi:putative membrane protein
MADTAPRREPLVLLIVVVTVFVALGIAPEADRMTWLLENVPVVIGVPILVWTSRSFPLTPLTYRLIAVHAVILMVGGYYTYAAVPLGNWASDTFNLGRNHYDRLGHFAQGFIPAMIAREFLIRRSPLRPGGMLSFLVVCYGLAFSAFFELFEWWTAVAFGAASDAYLGSQGDIWDAQWDMFMCLIGAAVALALLSKVQDRQLRAFGLMPDAPRA